MIYVPAALLGLFSATFLAVWLAERTRPHLLLYAAAFGLVGMAILLQVARIPADLGHNAVVSAALYAAGFLAFGEGVLTRSGERLPRPFHLLASIGIVAAITWFWYVDRDLRSRIYILNFGLAGMLLYTVWRARFLARGSRADRSLFWVVLLLALHFFPRTLLTGNVAAVTGPELFSWLTFWDWVQFSLSTLGVAMGLGLLVVTGADVIGGLRHERDSDPMTGLLNRRGLEAAAGSILTGRRGSDRTCVVVGDLDHFKSINDDFGHAAGDRVLVGFARLIRRSVRQGDLAARLGGEEFVIVLRECGSDKAFEFAERLRLGLHAMRFDGLLPERPVTCSFGVVELRRGEKLWAAIHRADQNLYAAKRTGRDRTVADGVILPLAARKRAR